MAGYSSTVLGGGAYGSVPVGPPAVSTAPGATAGAIAQGNLVYNQLPGYAGALANIGSTIGSETAGQVPGDVINLLKQNIAEGGVGHGTMGSDANNAAFRQALGLTSIGQQHQGLADLGQILPLLPGAAISQNPNFYPSTGQQYESDLQRNIFRAAPDPAAAAQAKLGAVQSGFNSGLSSLGGLPNLGGGGNWWDTNDNWWNQPEPNYQQVVAYGPGGGPDVGKSILTSGSPSNDISDLLSRYEPPSLLGDTQTPQATDEFGGYAMDDYYGDY